MTEHLLPPYVTVRPVPHTRPGVMGYWCWRCNPLDGFTEAFGAGVDECGARAGARAHAERRHRYAPSILTPEETEEVRRTRLTRSDLQLLDLAFQGLLEEDARGFYAADPLGLTPRLNMPIPRVRSMAALGWLREDTARRRAESRPVPATEAGARMLALWALAWQAGLVEHAARSSTLWAVPEAEQHAAYRMLDETHTGAPEHPNVS
ncbi:hypothetical protein ACWD3I_25130 [Streptomyces sp. NPDC002817]|uniref:hypothetical protein n=1 Tax=Streptomyces sp. NPDC088357 TaxID=3154655 RepID=UPI0034257146